MFRKEHLPVNYNRLSARERRQVRELYRVVQNGNCSHCGTPLNIRPERTKSINWRAFPKGFLKYPVHLHHSHDTHMTIGAVHAYCNAVLWQYHGE